MDDYGIGAAARVGLHVYEGASHGSGRTTRMLTGLQNVRQVVVMLNSGMVDHAKALMRHMDLPGTIVVSVGAKTLLRRQLGELRARYPSHLLVLDHTVVSRLYEEAIAQVREDFELEMGRFEHMGPDIVEPVARYEPGRGVR